MKHDVILAGCRRAPLANYLKALGVFRLVAEQLDPTARAFWANGVLVLSTSCDRDALVEFFADKYAPSPIVAPWNGGSGFYLKDTKDGILAIEQSTTERFVAYRDAIAVCRRLVADAGLTERPEGDEKHLFVERVRASVSDQVLRWIDAAVALEEDGPAYPPLLGTGGNDGRLDFSNNQMQRLAETLIATEGDRMHLRAALFDEPAPRLSRVAIGQFRPVSAGGANAGEGFDRESLVNPWDFILTLEGALVFAVAISRRMEAATPGVGSFPFTVRASGVGYGSAARSDEAEARDEMWLPIWSRPASFDEIRVLFGEGRATIGTRAARTGVDFARAIASLGVDRGIDEFTRVGFLVRNGLSYFATPLGDWSVAHVKSASLLDELDDWLLQLQRAAASKSAPASLRTAATRVDEAILNVCRRGDAPAVGALLCALGEVESTCAKSPKARESVRPLPVLSAAWFDAANDGTAEIRLAVVLAAGGLRRYLSSARQRGASTVWTNNDTDRVYVDRGLVDNLIAVVQRRVASEQSTALDHGLPASTGDLAALLNGELDEERIDALARGFCSLDWRRITLEPSSPRDVPSVFAFCRLALTARPATGIELPRTTGIVARLIAGDSITATRLAGRRLRGAGLLPRCGPISASKDLARCAAAALLFPLDASAIAALRRQIIRTISLEKSQNGAHRS